MAIIKDNVWIEGASGSARKGSIVYKQVAGKTVIAGRPEKTDRPPTEAQVQHRETFKRAIKYAELAMDNMTLKLEYDEAAEKGSSGFNRAVQDYMEAPEIAHIDKTSYTASLGDKIMVFAFDDFKIQEVTLAILDENGSVLQEGQAVKDPEEVYYAYTLTAPVAGLNTSVKVTATDVPGNSTERIEPLVSIITNS